MSCSKREFPAAKEGLCFLCLAVLFCLVSPCVCAQGLRCDLASPGLELLNWPSLSNEKGLSISLPTAPLLERKFKFTPQVDVDYDLRLVQLSAKAGNYPIGSTRVLDLPDYISMCSASQMENLWIAEQKQTSKNAMGGGRKDLLGYDIPIKFPKIISKIVGEGTPGLKVNGYRRISFAGRSQWQDGLTSTATYRQSKFPSLEMEQESKFSITGTIGSNMNVKVDQDTKRLSDLDNDIRLRYAGEEDEIIKSVELGNTSWQIPGLAGYSGTIKGLFGAKAIAQLGGLDLTLVASQEKGSTEKATFQAGTEVTPQIISDYDFLRWKYFYLGRATNLGHSVNDFSKGDSIMDLEVYRSDNRMDNTIPFGAAYIDPDSMNNTVQSPHYGKFKLEEKSAYYYGVTKDSTNFWIRFDRDFREDEVLAVYYRILRGSGVEDTIGNIKYNHGDTAFVLKLIKPFNPKPSDITWAYEWKNVYSLRAKNIDRNNFDLKIYQGQAVNGQINVDKDYQLPSGTKFIRIMGLDNQDQNLNPKPDGLVDLDIQKISLTDGLLIFPDKYPFNTNTSYTGNPGDTLNLKVDKIYNYENPDQRTNSSQYYIYVKTASRKSQYNLGQVNIIDGSEIVTLNGKRLTRGVDYDITYELGQITFTTDKALDPSANVTVEFEYAPVFMLQKKTLFGMDGKYDMGNLKMGLSALYKSEKTGEDRPRVGQEPVRNFVWDGNLSFNSSSSLLTKLTNALPLVETDAPSNLSVSAEVAQSLPNPNTKNDAFIDDFEGSLEYTDLGIHRGNWSLSSTPSEKEYHQRGRMTWYNPYNGINPKDIWPNIQTEQKSTDVLVLTLDRYSPHIPADTFFKSNVNVWNGVMRALPMANYNQTLTEFLEIWVNGDVGKIHIDLGQVNEDINGNHVLDTEDKKDPTTGWADGVLQAGEDVGLDHMTDEEERVYYGSDLADPSGDNWYYSSGSNDYSHINGTQGDSTDPDVGGRYPSTEDINGNLTLDEDTNYFEFTVGLSTLPVEGTRSNQGWKLYRISLKDSSSYKIHGSPHWNDIRFGRVWIEDCDLVKIASLQLVGNRWRSRGASPTQSGGTTGGGGTFEVFVINTHENTEYTSPPGVGGKQDQQTGLTEKEQSLALKYDALKPGYYGSADRYLYSPEDYTNYKNIKMYVHGPNDTTGLKFFFKLGTDSLNFYEYHTHLHPGWNDSNHVVINFEEITGMKSYMLESPPDSGGYDVAQGKYRIRGRPTFSAIRWFSMGVINEDTLSTAMPKSGEIWVDELRVADVRRNAGWAMRSSVSAAFADLLNISLTLNSTDSEFHNLRTNRGSGINTTSTALSTNTNLDKFLPPGLGLKLPFSYSWSKNLDVPRLKSGSDIVLPAEQRDQERTQSTNEIFSLNPSFRKDSKNWILNWTLNRTSTSMSYNKQTGRSPAFPVSNSSGYWVTGGYDLTPPKKLGLSPLTWSNKVFLLQKLSQTKFYYLPTTLRFNGTVNRLKSYSRNDIGTVTSIYTRDFEGGMNLAFVPVNPMSLGYTWGTRRDMRNDSDIKFSLNPSKVRLGIERNFTESFRAGYNPRIFSFLEHNFSFNSNYNENCDPGQFTDRTRSLTNTNTRSADFTLRLQNLVEKVLPGEKSKKESADKEKKHRANPLNWAGKRFSNLSKKISPLQASVSRTKDFVRSGLLDRPSFAYQLGFTDDPGVGMKPNSLGAINDAVTTRDNYTLKSGIAIFRNANVDVSYSQGITDTRNPNAHTENRSKTFPDLSVNWSNVSKFKFLDKYINNLGLRSRYSKQINTTTDKLINQPTSRKTSMSLNPLASLSLSWRNGIRTDLTLNQSEEKDEDLSLQGGNRAITINADRTITLNNSYSFRAPHGIKLPLLNKIKFESNLSMSLSISHKTNKQKKSIQGNSFGVTGHRTELAITPSAGYSLSSQVQAGLSGMWVDTNDKLTNIKTHIRQLGIWFEIRF